MEIVFRATVIFFFLWLLTRAVGKSTLSELSAFDLLLLVVLGDIVQQSITQEDASLVGGALAATTVGFWVLTFSWVGYRFKRLRPVVDGLPVIVVRNGRVIDEALRLERLPTDELLEAAREQGIRDIRDVETGILEPDGKLSFIQSKDS